MFINNTNSLSSFDVFFFESVQAFFLSIYPLLQCIFAVFFILMYLAFIVFYAKYAYKTISLYWILFQESHGVGSTLFPSSGSDSTSSENGETPKTRWQKVKHHFYNHWPWYVGGAVVIGVGLGVYYYISCGGATVENFSESLSEKTNQEAFEGLIDGYVQRTLDSIELVRTKQDTWPPGYESSPFQSREELVSLLTELRGHPQTQEVVERLVVDLPKLQHIYDKYLDSVNLETGYVPSDNDIQVVYDLKDALNNVLVNLVASVQKNIQSQGYLADQFMAVVYAEALLRNLNPEVLSVFYKLGLSVVDGCVVFSLKGVS